MLTFSVFSPHLVKFDGTIKSDILLDFNTFYSRGALLYCLTIMSDIIDVNTATANQAVANLFSTLILTQTMVILIILQIPLNSVCFVRKN